MPAVVRAQGNDLFSPTGGRSALMGNTGVALSRDGAAPFYNPATIVHIRDERLAFSVNFYALSLIDFSGFHEPGSVDATIFGTANAADTGLTSSTLRVLPSTLCLFFTLDELTHFSKQAPVDSVPEQVPRTKLALCFASLESEDVDVQAIRFQGTTSAGHTAHVQSFQRRWTRTYFGPTYSTYIDRTVALGASLHAAYTATSFGIGSNSVSDKLGGGAVASTLGTSGSGYSFELTAVLGADYYYGPFTIGASLRVPSLHLIGAYNATFNRSTHGAGNDAALVSEARGTLRTAAPLRAAVGFGFSGRRLTLELDGALEIPIADEIGSDLVVKQTSTTGTGTQQTRHREAYRVASRLVLNPSVGAEYFTSPTFSVLGGMSANFTSLPPLRPAPSVGNLVQARASHVSASAGVGSYWDGGDLLFGVQVDYGWGRALAVNPFQAPNGWSVVQTRSYGAMFVISGATDLGAIMHLVHRVTGDDEAATSPSVRASREAT